MSSILPGTPQAALLQSEVHRELVRRGYVEASDDDDTTMAEYVAVMLINRKSPEQIEAELRDLLGGEFDSSFTPWLYKRLEDVSSGALAAPGAPPVAAAIESDDVDMRDTSRSSRSANGSARLLSTALNPLANQPAATTRGLKRSASPPSVGEGKRRSVGNERNGPPTGPRRAGRGVELLGRIGGHSSRYGMNAEAPEFRGGHGGMRGGRPPVGGPFRRQPAGMDPYMQQQQQQAAMMAAMSRGAGFMMGNEHAHVQHLQEQMMHMQAMMQQMAQAVQIPQQPQPPKRPTAQPPQKLGSHTIEARKGVPSKDSPLPTAPTSSDICRFGVACTNARCHFSHPSPVATQASGIVLRTEACPQGRACKDADCGYSHVSPAQVASSAEGPATLKVLCKYPVCTNPSCQYRHEDAEGNVIPPPALSRKTNITNESAAMDTDDHDDGLDVQVDSATGGMAAQKMNVDAALPDTTSSSRPMSGKPMNGTIPVACKFATACTNKYCKYVHDGRRPCKFGTKCHRADCSFSHPPGRQPMIAKEGFSPFKPKAHLSERAFATEGEATEKALPGGGGGGQEATGALEGIKVE